MSDHSYHDIDELFGAQAAQFGASFWHPCVAQKTHQNFNPVQPLMSVFCARPTASCNPVQLILAPISAPMRGIPPVGVSLDIENVYYIYI